MVSRGHTGRQLWKFHLQPGAPPLPEAPGNFGPAGPPTGRHSAMRRLPERHHASIKRPKSPPRPQSGRARQDSTQWNTKLYLNLYSSMLPITSIPRCWPTCGLRRRNRTAELRKDLTMTDLRFDHRAPLRRAGAPTRRSRRFLLTLLASAVVPLAAASLAVGVHPASAAALTQVSNFGPTPPA